MTEISNLIQKHLFLHQLTTIPADDLVQNHNLKVLHLHSNEIYKLYDNQLIVLSQLTFLRLSYNKIQTIDQHSLNGLYNLERVFFDHNKIHFIHPLAFKGLVSLKYLHLDNNKIKYIEPKTFITLIFNDIFHYSNLQFIDLSDNEMEFLHPQAFSDLNSLSRIYLNGNRWKCDCKMAWFSRWITEQRMTRNIDLVQCKKPPKISNIGRSRSKVLRNTNRIRTSKCALCSLPVSAQAYRLDMLPLANFTCKAPVVDIHVYDQSKQNLEEIEYNKWVQPIVTAAEQDQYYDNDKILDEDLGRTTGSFMKRKSDFLPEETLQRLQKKFPTKNFHSFNWNDDLYLAADLLNRDKAKRLLMTILPDQRNREYAIILSCNTTGFPVTDSLLKEQDSEHKPAQIEYMEFVGRYDISFMCDILPANVPFPSGKTLMELMNLRKVGNITDLNDHGFLSGNRINLKGKKWPPTSITENQINKEQDTGYTGLVYTVLANNIHTDNAAIKINTRNKFIIQNRAAISFRMMTNSDWTDDSMEIKENRVDILNMLTGRVLVEVPYKHHLKLSRGDLSFIRIREYDENLGFSTGLQVVPVLTQNEKSPKLAGSVVSKTDSSIVVAIEKKRTKLICEVEGYPEPAISWLLPNERIIKAGEKLGKIYVDEKTGTLQITSTDSSYSGQYRCLATCGIDKNHLAVRRTNVIILPKRINKVLDTEEQRKRRTKAKKKETVLLTCDMTNVLPTVSIFWITPKRLILQPGEKNSNPDIMALQNNTLLLENITTKHRGPYRCVAANLIGYDISTWWLSVVRGGSKSNRSKPNLRKIVITPKITEKTKPTEIIPETTTAVTTTVIVPEIVTVPEETTTLATTRVNPTTTVIQTTTPIVTTVKETNFDTPEASGDEVSTEMSTTEPTDIEEILEEIKLEELIETSPITTQIMTTTTMETTTLPVTTTLPTTTSLITTTLPITTVKTTANFLTTTTSVPSTMSSIIPTTQPDTTTTQPPTTPFNLETTTQIIPELIELDVDPFPSTSNTTEFVLYNWEDLATEKLTTFFNLTDQNSDSSLNVTLPNTLFEDLTLDNSTRIASNSIFSTIPKVEPTKISLAEEEEVVLNPEIEVVTVKNTSPIEPEISTTPSPEKLAKQEQMRLGKLRQIEAINKFQENYLAPPRVLHPYKVHIVEASEEVTSLHCPFISAENVSVLWIAPNNAILKKTLLIKKDALMEFSKTTFHFDEELKVYSRNTGKYNCVVSNKMGSEEAMRPSRK